MIACCLMLAVLPMRVEAAGAAPGAAFIAFDRQVAATKAAMMADPEQARRDAEQLGDLARHLPPSRAARLAVATAQWLQAEALLGTNAPTRAGPIVMQAIGAVEQEAPHSKLLGDLYRSRGAIAGIEGNAQEALAYFQRAFEIFRIAGERRSQALTLMDIGGIYQDAQDYGRVLSYYNQSAEIYPDDPALLLISHNNRGEVLRSMKRYREAIGQYRAALVDSRKVGSALLETRILTNLVLVEVDAGDLAAADQTLARAMRLSQSGEARSWRTTVFAAAAKVAAARGDDRTAAALLARTFAGMDLSKTQMEYREFHELASTVYDRIGQPDLALTHLRAFQRLDSEARALTASTNAQLMAARFDFSNQNLKISALKQGQLQRDVEIERQQTRLRTVVLGGLLGAVAIVLALLLAGYVSMRRSRNMVRAANDNLTDSNVKLEKALKAKTEFLAMTSHEIRTPLNGILGMTQVLLADGHVAGEVRGKIEVVNNAGETMRALVDDILDIAKMEQGDVAVVDEETDVCGVLESAVRLWSGQAEAKGMSLSLQVDSIPARIMSDEARLRQIVFNLMSNAVKFTLSGGVRLAARVTSADDVEALEITVTDSGIGIAADQHELIFEAFRQVDAGTSRRFGGTGLGLAICRRLAAALGGTVTVVSEPDVGSTFTLRLPLRRVAEMAPADMAATLPEAALLLVERNLLVQGMMRGLLGAAVAHVETAVDGRAALDAIATRRVSHVLAEAGSASIDGQEALASLRDIAAAARAAGVRFSVLFAPNDDITAATLMAAGVPHSIAKPIDAAGLLAALAAYYAPDFSSPAATMAEAA